MTIDSLEIIVLTCVFVAPGFIIDGVIKAFCPTTPPKEGIQLLRCIIYSVLQCALLSWCYFLIWWEFKERNLILFIILVCIITLIGALLIGTLFGILKSKQLLRILARKLKFNVNYPIPTAWDYYFSKQIGTHLIVTLIDGTTLYGYWGGDSYCSSSADGRDIYIEKLYRFNDQNGEWTENKESHGVIINQNQIEYIEFVSKGDKNE